MKDWSFVKANDPDFVHPNDNTKHVMPDYVKRQSLIEAPDVHPNDKIKSQPVLPMSQTKDSKIMSNPDAPAIEPQTKSKSNLKQSTSKFVADAGTSLDSNKGDKNVKTQKAHIEYFDNADSLWFDAPDYALQPHSYSNSNPYAIDHGHDVSYATDPYILLLVIALTMVMSVCVCIISTLCCGVVSFFGLSVLRKQPGKQYRIIAREEDVYVASNDEEV